MSDADRAAAGIAPLPVTLEEATDALRASTVLRAAMGETLHDSLVAVRREGARRRHGHQRRRALRTLPVPILSDLAPWPVEVADVIAINTPLESP